MLIEDARDVLFSLDAADGSRVPMCGLRSRCSASMVDPLDVAIQANQGRSRVCVRVLGSARRILVGIPLSQGADGVRLTRSRRKAISYGFASMEHRDRDGRGIVSAKPSMPRGVRTGDGARRLADWRQLAPHWVG